MDLKNLVEALDAKVVSGDILGAFDQFFADNVKTLSGPNDVTTSKAQKAEALGWFFSGIAKINRIERPAVAVNGNVTDSQFVFDFTGTHGNSLVFSEVIRRTWNNGKVVEELYLPGQTVEIAQAPAAKKAAAPKATAPKTTEEVGQPKAAAAPKTAEKVSQPKAAEAPKAAAPKKAAAKTAAPKASKKA